MVRPAFNAEPAGFPCIALQSLDIFSECPTGDVKLVCSKDAKLGEQNDSSDEDDDDIGIGADLFIAPREFGSIHIILQWRKTITSRVFLTVGILLTLGVDKYRVRMNNSGTVLQVGVT